MNTRKSVHTRQHKAPLRGAWLRWRAQWLVFYSAGLTIHVRRAAVLRGGVSTVRDGLARASALWRVVECGTGTQTVYGYEYEYGYGSSSTRTRTHYM